MTTSEAINEIATACAKAQQALKPAVKAADNPAYRSKYADLAAVIDAARVYALHDVAVYQDVTHTEAGASVVTRLVHKSGQWIECGPLVIPLGSKRDAHAVGSATTYAKRYALSAALNISADEDDDGNAAVQGSPARTPQQKPEAFDAWRAQLAVAAGKGIDAMRDVYMAGTPAQREYLDNEDLNKLRAQASTVTRTTTKEQANRA